MNNESSSSNQADESIRTRGTHDKFLFDCDHLIMFCSNFEKLDIHDHTDSILEVKLEDLENRWEKMQTSYECLMLITEPLAARDFKENARVKFNACSDAYYIARSHILDVLRISGVTFRTENPRLGLPHPAMSQLHSTAQTAHIENSVCIKIPPCDTEVFKGGYDQWPSFRDMFTAVYINHPKLTRAQKLYHLRNKTKDNAGAIVKRYPLCDENFELAWSALKARYENKRVLVDNQLKILFNIPVASVENSDSIQKIQATVNDCLSTLKTLDVSIGDWDPILIYLISTKLPDETLSLWEQSLKSHRDLPRWTQMDEFLINRYEVVERISSIRATKDQRHSLPVSGTHKTQTYLSQEKLNVSCPLCESNHSIRLCPEFRKFSGQERIDFAYKSKICNNCLSPAHVKNNCKSKKTCLACKKKHHTLLHLNSVDDNSASNKITSDQHVSNINPQISTQSNPEFKYPSQQTSTSKRHYPQVQANFSSNSETILLRTALVQIEHQGDLFSARALIDPGSQRTFMSERIRNFLKIPSRKAHFEIIGVGGHKQTSNKECELVLYAHRYDIRFTINAIVLPKVTKHLPTVSFSLPHPEEFQDMDLADPNFNKSAHIDLILGNDYEHFINIDGIKKNLCGSTSAYNTVFGWVLSGPVKADLCHSFTTNVVASENSQIRDELRKFWEQEEIPSGHPISAEDEFCEQFYQETTTRRSDGRYVVRLPFKPEFLHSLFLGSSRFSALGQYARMEKNLSKDPELQGQYNAVLNEYISLGHMEETSPLEISSEDKFKSFYLPHHAVVRPEHKTTKVRVVFNASRKSKSGFSLNDMLLTGPTLQNDLVSTILNWRRYKYVFSGDIQKMYRQILVHSDDRPYQRILHQPNPHSAIKDYHLNTVTFGVNCAPFLAIRTLLQLACDSEAKHPLVASVLRKETYVDDILSGGFSIEEILKLQRELIATLNSAGLPLKKFTANDQRLLDHLPSEDLYDSNFLRFHESSSTKTLGIKWNALRDTFTYSFGINLAVTSTKRHVLSIVAQLFDPAGWITPVVIRAKIFMQELWLEGNTWDETLSQGSQSKWETILVDLPQIEEIIIPRWIRYTPCDLIEIHGFSDASKSAFCACVYIRCQSPNLNVYSNILIAKSKVAPLNTISLPKLELNGAALLAKLVKYVLSTINLQITDTILWTDSSIVLGWLSKPPCSWETYIANRTAQIHSLVPNASWRHVPTHDNPADLGTRGCKPQDLAHNSLWWNGPNWLSDPPATWPKSNPLNTQETHIRVQTLQSMSEETDILTRFSSYPRSLRVLSYVFRFFHRTHSNTKACTRFPVVSLSHSEIQFVKIRLITLAQNRYYGEEYGNLLNSQQISEKSHLNTLNPLMDTNKLLRVNGRLSDSSLPYNERYPIILPGNSRLSHLYLLYLHTFLCHADCNQMCRMVRTEFYISRLKPRVKAIIHKCKICVIFKQKSCAQLMAPLPLDRCTITPPFHVTGIDFAGPFELKSSSLRNSPTVKGYVSVFVCFSTKSVHLEVCSDLSSAAFQAAFARFVGRRGLPKRVVSDNGRNFVGASRSFLKEYSQFLKLSASDISGKYSTQGFEWSFIPPHAPHMGGLWEAAVKSFKYHFKRISGAQKFTFEQISTVLARIESVLNSRPISAMSEDPADLTALTPGHFLKGAPILALPESLSENLSLIDKWIRLKALHHQFAIRWKEDYLKSLHKRYKWKNSTPNLNTGDLVVVMDDLLPPNEWRLGRIEKTYQGPDQRVRVASVRTSGGVITRPIVKLCYLPYQNDQNSSN